MTVQTTTEDRALAILTEELDALADQAMAEWKVPAAAIAVVQNGETTLLRAYGQRDAEAGLPTTTNTQFTICSITKTFTATGLAMLVDEGRLDWTKPVRDYVPEFRLHDAVATDRVTVRDLLCHHSGLPRHDWIWMPVAFRARRCWRRCAILSPAGISGPAFNTAILATTPRASLLSGLAG
jgi:CubicO group peptidase (beta-lactamase class C family)